MLLQVKSIPPPLPGSQISDSSTPASSSRLSPSFLGTWHFLAVPDVSNHSFHTCFQTSWAWSKDTALLCSVQYYTVKYTKARPLVEDACTWQCVPDPCTNLCECTLTSLKVCSLRVPILRRGLAVSTPLLLSSGGLTFVLLVAVFAACKWIAVHLTREFFLGSDLTIRLQPRHLHQLQAEGWWQVRICILAGISVPLSREPKGEFHLPSGYYYRHPTPRSTFEKGSLH